MRERHIAPQAHGKCSTVFPQHGCARVSRPVGVPAAAFWDTVGEAGGGESTRVVGTHPEPSRRFGHFLLAGTMATFTAFPCWPLPTSPSASGLGTSLGRGSMVRGQYCLCVEFCLSLRRTRLYLVQVLRWCLCQSSISFGVGDWQLQPWGCRSVMLSSGV